MKCERCEKLHSTVVYLAIVDRRGKEVRVCSACYMANGGWSNDSRSSEQRTDAQ